MARVREASHAGSWYSDDEERLSLELDRWLDAVPETAPCIGPLSANEPASFPTEGARIIIAPHAGYSYSGKPAAWAYKALDMSKAKRVFILGPSHHFYLTRCALSQCTAYQTPFGDLPLDLDTIAELKQTGMFDEMSQSVDEEEHSIEMHLPYVFKVLARAFSDYSSPTPIIPILVGNTSGATEAQYGALLAPYLADPSSIFIISSDFAHWGSRFRYTYYRPLSGPPVMLKASDRTPASPRIHESIAAVDMECAACVESGEHEAFLEVLERTGNTVCGRHPIGIAIAALDVMRKQRPEMADRGKFRCVRYERSSDCTSVRDSSVSYCSAFAVV